MVGRTLSHYRIIAPLGQGGMGVVYRAHDLHLERDVAIKLLPAGALGDEEARRRFRREALALSKLNHPNIGIIHDFDSQDGTDFLVMELVPGSALSARVAQGPMPESELRAVGAQIADALAAAHALGIVHRDIKPANVMLTPDGRAKVLDFGLAKTMRTAADAETASTVTVTMEIAGTPPYMSPEQLRGEKVDARTDVYALGALLFEMATGRRAFDATQSARLIGAILNEPPTPPRRLRPDLNPDIEDVIQRCLEKDPGRRFQTSAEITKRLRGEGVAPRARGGRAVTLPAPVLAGAIVIVTATLALIGANVGGLREKLLGADVGRVHSIAVLPLENYSGDANQVYFADGMTEELITALAQVGGLRVTSRSSVMQFRGSHAPIPKIGRQLHVDAVVEGSVERGGDRVRITARLVDTGSDRNLWAANYERDERDVLSLQDEVARQVAKEVRARLTPEQEARLTAPRPVVPAAHEAYLRGLYEWNLNNAASLQRALSYFSESIRVDSSYASAWAGLANTYASMSSEWLPSEEAMPKARAAVMTALRLDPSLSEAHEAAGYILGFYDWDREAAEREFKRAIELNPSNPGAHTSYGYLLDESRRFDDARREFEAARVLDPLSELNSTYAMMPTYHQRRFDELEREARDAIAKDPAYAQGHFFLGAALVGQHRTEEGIPEMRFAYDRAGIPHTLASIGFVEAARGHQEQALAILAQLDSLSRHVPVPQYSRAVVYAGLGERDEALDWLRRGVQAHDEGVGFIDVDPQMDPLRSDPRFEEIRRAVGLTH